MHGWTSLRVESVTPSLSSLFIKLLDSRTRNSGLFRFGQLDITDTSPVAYAKITSSVSFLNYFLGGLAQPPHAF